MLEALKWKKFPVLNDGFVCLVDCMGTDASVVQAARVSYGNDVRTTNVPVTDVGIAFEKDLAAQDRNLIRYLMRNRHTTPFEMAELKFLVRVPMDCWRQWIRHRMASVNEYSTRYTEAIDSMQTTAPDEWRMQATNNKQGSAGSVTEWPPGWRVENNDDADPEVGAHATSNLIYESEGIRLHECNAGAADMTPGDYLTQQEESLQDHARAAYTRRLALGVAREQARKDLPLSTYTEAYWKIDLHNLLHFLGLRMDSHAQQEIRSYATIIGEQIVKPLFPVVWEAFEDYRLGAMSLSRPDLAVLQLILVGDMDPAAALLKIYSNTRERDECSAKLLRMGFMI